MPLATAEEPLISPQEEIEKAFEVYHARVLRTAWRVTGNASDAEDALQTVFLRLLRRDESQPPLGNLEAYLHRAAVNAALDIVRARREGPAPSDGPGSANLRSSGASGDPEPRELQEFVRQSLASLAPQAAEIFTLRFFEGHSNAEIAKMLGISAVRVAVIVHRTRGKLQKEIGRRFSRHGVRR